MPKLTEAQIIAKMQKLHDIRRTMSQASLYQGNYMQIAIELNIQLNKVAGKDYVDYSEAEKKQLCFKAAIFHDKETIG